MITDILTTTVMLIIYHHNNYTSNVISLVWYVFCCIQYNLCGSTEALMV